MISPSRELVPHLKIEGRFMSLYEHIVVSRPDISSTQVEEFVQNLATKIENMGGSVEGAEYWGLRNLAYRMKKNRKAHYSMLKINALSLIHI